MKKLNQELHMKNQFVEGMYVTIATNSYSRM